MRVSKATVIVHGHTWESERDKTYAVELPGFNDDQYEQRDIARRTLRAAYACLVQEDCVRVVFEDECGDCLKRLESDGTCRNPDFPTNMKP